LLALILALAGTSALGAEPAEEIRIGVLSHRGEAVTERMWSPTADYLNAALPDHRFRIVPLDFSVVDPAVADAAVDFVLVNPGIYVNLEVRHRVSRIATMRNRIGQAERNVFGGVIFTRAGHPGLARLEDLRGHSLLAVDQESLGGFQMAWSELAKRRIDPWRDLKRLAFAGTHDAVVLAVGRGDYDAGTVRTDILEQMEAEGTIRLADYRVLDPQQDPDFPFVRSTPLFPEWPFSKLPHTSDDLAQAVAIALLQMPEDHGAARAGAYAGWTVPLDYQPVHDLLKRLRLPPYDRPPPFTLREAIARYWFGLLLGALALLVMAVLTTWVSRLNTRLVKAKARLEQQQELILNSVAEGIYGVDLSGRTTFVNRSMVRLTGWRPDELIGANQHAILHHTHGDGRPHPASECAVYATFRDSQPRFVDDDVFWRKDGSSFPVEYSSTPIRDEQGATVGTVVVFRDVTERKQAAERVRQHQAELAHVARLSTLGEMASGIAHELNQPLTAIATNARACVRMLESGRSGGEQCSDVMERIAAQAERAGEVIRQIRHFVRKEPPNLRPTRIRQIFDTVLGLLRPEAQRAGVELVVDQPPGDPSVLAQEIQIEQVLLNLGRNAIEAMTDTLGPHRLTLSASPPGDGHIALTVSDTGPGLTAEIRERAFEPFVTTKPQGMGLGLSISAGIIEAHGSTLSVRSEPGAGASFQFTLPLVETDDQSHD
jgi:two-component system sensor histidine kinase TtrS